MKPTSVSQNQPFQIVRPLLSVFISYIHRSLYKHFHAVRVAADGLPPAVPMDRPLVVYLNHASWWDPLIMMWLGNWYYPNRPQYGPIEASQLRRYSFFKYLGVFGVERGTLSGAREFLRVADAVLTQEGGMLWMTPQGRFADVRERPLAFASGLAHLALRRRDALLVPLAIEYGFGQEKFPEIFVRFGTPLDASTLPASAGMAQTLLEEGLESALNGLSEAVVRKDEREFQTLVSGRGGASLPYDLWRIFKGLVTGKSAALNHSSTQ